MTLHVVATDVYSPLVVHHHVRRAMYTPGSGLRCTRCDVRGVALYEYSRGGDSEGAMFKGLFCSDRCFCGFHKVSNKCIEHEHSGQSTGFLDLMRA